jgi:hypothetical protein
MLTIHESQMAACSEVSTQSFADAIVRHLVTTCPSACDALGRAAVEGVVMRGVAVATASGITSRKDLCLYLAATSALGEGFASRPPWADIMSADNPDSPSQKATQLWTAAKAQTPDASSSQGSTDGDGSSSQGSADGGASAALAVALALASESDLAGPLPAGAPVAPCVLPPRSYPMSL